MLKLKSLTIQNFMSIGANFQTIDFEDSGLTLILGENLDTANDSCVGRNGCGKSAILNALAFGLFGKCLDPDIKRIDALVNNINDKGLCVIVEFEKNGHHYRIERTRKPAKLKFVIDNQEQSEENLVEYSDSDESQGENRHTQEEIDKILGIGLNLFKHIVALTTGTQPFLSMSSKNQREFIEELLGISALSEKAERLKEDLKETKNLIKNEEIRIETIEANNKRILSTIDNLKKQSMDWQTKKNKKLEELATTLINLQEVDVEQEIKNLEIVSQYKNTQKEIKAKQFLLDREKSDLSNLEKNIKKTNEKLNKVLEQKCPTCDQALHDIKHQEILENLQEDLKKYQEKAVVKEHQILEISQSLLELEGVIEHMGQIPECFYHELSDAYNHRNSITMIENEIDIVDSSTNPFESQISALENENIQEPNYEKINQLSMIRDHQEFLFKLLTNKDSFIRKKIIDQNLAFLNNKLSEFLEKLGLPHVVRFMNDLSVDITHYGKELDFGNLSRGEQTRLILALSWCFRELYEIINQPINIIFIDELLDNGLDSQGVENAMNIIKREMVHKKGHEAFIISHRDELISKIGNVLKVTKQGGFTEFELVSDYIQ